MISVRSACLMLCVLTVHSAEETGKTKNKRDVSGLFPFPRVGRAPAPWNLQQLGPVAGKRQGLIPFPRVGRGDVVQGSSGGGMWFGPRLGRMHKRDVPQNNGWALVQIRDLPSSRVRSIMRENFTPRMGRDSSEEYHDEAHTPAEDSNQ